MSQADAVSTSPLPPGVTEAALSRALDGFAAALGADRVLTSDADLREFRDPFAHATWDDVHRLGGRHADDGGGDPGDPARRQRAQGAALDARQRAQQRLRRAGAARARLGDREPAQHEPRARDQRGAAPTPSSSRACAGSTSTRRSRPAATS